MTTSRRQAVKQVAGRHLKSGSLGGRFLGTRRSGGDSRSAGARSFASFLAVATLHATLASTSSKPSRLPGNLGLEAVNSGLRCFVVTRQSAAFENPGFPDTVQHREGLQAAS